MVIGIVMMPRSASMGFSQNITPIKLKINRPFSPAVTTALTIICRNICMSVVKRTISPPEWWRDRSATESVCK